MPRCCNEFYFMLPVLRTKSKQNTHHLWYSNFKERFMSGRANFGIRWGEMIFDQSPFYDYCAVVGLNELLCRPNTARNSSCNIKHKLWYKLVDMITWKCCKPKLMQIKYFNAAVRSNSLPHYGYCLMSTRLFFCLPVRVPKSKKAKHTKTKIDVNILSRSAPIFS